MTCLFFCKVDFSLPLSFFTLSADENPPNVIMFQDNPLLAQLKQQIHDSKERVEGTVKGTDKAYGFLECDKKSYFISPVAMKKVMHGDKISATIEKQGGKARPAFLFGAP